MWQSTQELQQKFFIWRQKTKSIESSKMDVSNIASLSTALALFSADYIYYWDSFVSEIDRCSLWLQHFLTLTVEPLISRVNWSIEDHIKTVRVRLVAIKTSCVYIQQWGCGSVWLIHTLRDLHLTIFIWRLYTSTKEIFRHKYCSFTPILFFENSGYFIDQF